MPRGDRTGPEGMGAMTGRAVGYCAGSTVPGYMNPIGGRGMALGRGRRGGMGGGFGRGRGFQYPVAVPVPAVAPEPVLPVTPAPQHDASSELNALRSQAEEIMSSLTAIQKRIEKLEAPGTDQKAE